MNITSDLYGFNSHLPKPYLLSNPFSCVLSLHTRTRSWSPNHSSELVLRHGAFSLSGILGHRGPLTAYQKEPHPFDQDKSRRLNRPPLLSVLLPYWAGHPLPPQCQLPRSAFPKLPPLRTGLSFQYLVPSLTCHPCCLSSNSHLLKKKSQAMFANISHVFLIHVYIEMFLSTK